MNLNFQPFFSIIIPTKNRSELIADTVSSVLSQDYQDIEVIVVDNDDTPATANILGAYRDSRLRHIRTGGLSMPENWEIGLRAAKGKYIMLTADKTGLKQGGLQWMSQYIAKFPSIVAFNYDYDIYYEDQRSYHHFHSRSRNTLLDPKQLTLLLLNSRFDKYIVACRGYNSCIKKSSIDEVLNKQGWVCRYSCNPDYSIGYHLLMLNAPTMHVPSTPLLTRVKSRTKRECYGNGNSYVAKSSRFSEYLDELKKSSLDYCSMVPIKDFLVYSALANDFIKVSRLWGHDYSIFKVGYYFTNYKETLWRESLGAQVIQEKQEVWRAASKEVPWIRFVVYSTLLLLDIRSAFYPVKKVIGALRRRLASLARDADEQKIFSETDDDSFLSIALGSHTYIAPDDAGAIEYAVNDTCNLFRSAEIDERIKR